MTSLRISVHVKLYRKATSRHKETSLQILTPQVSILAHQPLPTTHQAEFYLGMQWIDSLVITAIIRGIHLQSNKTKKMVMIQNVTNKNASVSRKDKCKYSQLILAYSFINT